MKRLVISFSLWAFILAAPLISCAQGAKPIKIGFVFVLSGRLATFGTLSKQGAQLAVDQVNQAMGILDRKVEALFVDSRGDPAHAAEEFRKLVRDQGVDVVIGPSLSPVAQSIAPLAQELGVPLIIPVAQIPEVTGRRCNKYTFRIGQNLLQNTEAAARIASELKARRWTTVGPDYSYGHQAWYRFKISLGRLKRGTVFLPSSQVAFASTETSDWGPEIEKVLKSDADGVLVTLFSGNLIDFVRQARRTDFFNKDYAILMNLGASTEVLYTLRTLLPEGVWLGAPYWFQAEFGLSSFNFVRAYRHTYNAVPSWPAHGAYCAVIAYAQAAGKAGSVDKNAIVQALEGLSLELPVGDVVIRPEDHQAVVPAIWGQTATDTAFRFRVLNPMRILQGPEITPSPQETGCNMKR